MSEEHNKSELAIEIEQLKESISSAMLKRPRLPQPLFWSLFGQRIREIRKRREAQRALAAILDGD